MVVRKPKVAGELITFRCPPDLSARVSEVIARDAETRSTVLRRLIRIGLRAESRVQEHTEAA